MALSMISSSCVLSSASSVTPSRQNASEDFPAHSALAARKSLEGSPQSRHFVRTLLREPILKSNDARRVAEGPAGRWVATRCRTSS